MRQLAKKILLKAMQESGWAEVLFQSGKITDNSGIIESVIDAMIEFKSLNQKTKPLKEAKFTCRLHIVRKNCREYLNNKNTCKTCLHFIETNK